MRHQKPTAIRAAIIIVATSMHASAASADCVAGQTGRACFDAGFALTAAKWCKNIKALIEPDEMLRAQPDYQRGGRAFFTRTQLKSHDEACSFALKFFGSSSEFGIAIVRPAE